jgi:hypothetical protein
MLLIRPGIEVVSMLEIPLRASRRIGQTPWPFLEADALGLKDLTFAGSQIRHVVRLSGNFSIAKAQRAVRVSSRSRSSVYAAFVDIAQLLPGCTAPKVREFTTVAPMKLRAAKG